MNSHEDMVLLARMLEAEFSTGSIDRARAHDLAERLLPQHPELHHTLTSVCRRMSRRFP